MKISVLLLMSCQQMSYPLMFWSQYSPKERIWWNKASLSIFLAHHMTETFSRHKPKWARRDLSHRVLPLCLWSNPAPVHRHINFLLSLGRWEIFAKGGQMPPQKWKKLYFWLDPCKRRIKNTEEYHFRLFLGFIFFLSPSLLLILI